MIQLVLTYATQETDNPDLRDRAYVYWWVCLLIMHSSQLEHSPTSIVLPLLLLTVLRTAVQSLFALLFLQSFLHLHQVPLHRHMSWSLCSAPV